MYPFLLKILCYAIYYKGGYIIKKGLFKISIILFSLILMTSIILPENNANADSNQSNTPNEIGKKLVEILTN